MPELNNQQAKCPCRKVIPILIILLGVFFLLQNLGILSIQIVSIIWPIIIILIGLKKLFKGMCKCYLEKK